MALCFMLVLTHCPFGVPFGGYNEGPSVCHVCVCVHLQCVRAELWL